MASKMQPEFKERRANRRALYADSARKLWDALFKLDCSPIPTYDSRRTTRVRARLAQNRRVLSIAAV